MEKNYKVGLQFNTGKDKRIAWREGGRGPSSAAMGTYMVRMQVQPGEGRDVCVYTYIPQGYLGASAYLGATVRVLCERQRR